MEKGRKEEKQNTQSLVVIGIFVIVVLGFALATQGVFKKNYSGGSTYSAALRSATVNQPYAIEEFKELRDVSCEIYEQLVEDHLDGVCIQKGACERSPEKFRKTCVSRINNAMDDCSAGKVVQARTELRNTLNAMDDHIGLRVHYCLTNQIDCGLVARRLGEPWLTESDVNTGSLTEARNRVLQIGKHLAPQNPLPAYPLAVYASLYQRLQQQNVCE